MATIIKPKRSETSSSAPTTSNLAVGEIAINTADQKIYTRDSGNNIVTLAQPGLLNVVEDTTPQLGGSLDTNGNHINFADNDKAKFGADSDLQIYHNGTISYIDENGTGDLRIQSNFLRLVDRDNLQTTATFDSNGVLITTYYPAGVGTRCCSSTLAKDKLFINVGKASTYTGIIGVGPPYEIPDKSALSPQSAITYPSSH